jgi:putative cardiolipin synthase
VRRAKSEIIFITPYYVPGDSGVQLIRDLVAKGVQVIILTNSLASNNHVPVHSAYARYRRDVIKAGAELYEIRANSARELKDDEKSPDVLTLHTKVFLIDRRYMFVGSLNLDPRSIEINAEMGLLIDSEPMVRSYLEGADEKLSAFAYRVIVNEKGQLEWHGRIKGQEVIETKEPLTSGWLRFKAWLMKIVPENQL